nr:hypothetical protein [Tanacetum cinerariifolium]
MSDSDESEVTYTDISSPLEELSDIGSPRADDHEYLMLPEILEDPYVEVALQAPPSQNYVPGPEHADDEIVAEDQPYAEDASPIAQSPEYVPESDFEMHPEDDDDEDPEEDPVDYTADGGDDGDDEEESSEDDENEEDDEVEVEADEEEEEEEHPARADSVVVAPTAADQAPSAEEKEPFETDESAATPPPHPAYCMTARISIPAPVHMPAWTDSEVARLLAISSPPASPLSPWSSSPPQIPFPPLPPILSPPSPILAPAPPPSPIRSLGYRAAMIRLRDEAASTSHDLAHYHELLITECERESSVALSLGNLVVQQHKIYQTYEFTNIIVDVLNQHVFQGISKRKVALQASPSPDYIPSPEEPEQAPPS